MSKRIVFFNCFHNGDVHVSRGFVRQIMNKVHQLDPSVQFAYGHKNTPDLLSDIPNLGFDSSFSSAIRSEHDNLVCVGDTVYINTWYAQQQFKYMNRHGITIDTIYDALEDSCKTLWDFSLSDISGDPSIFFPTIDYSKLNVGTIKNWIDNHPEKKILVESGPALSNQATNFPMGPIISQLANKYPDKSFILTSQEGVTLPNVFYTSNITNRGGKTDLNEISFISSHCDVMIGRASGVWSFSLTQDNLFKRKMTYLCFSNLVPKKEGKFWLGAKFEDIINYSSNIITTNESDVDVVRNIIERHL